VRDPSVPKALCDFLETSPVALSLAGIEGDHPLLFVNARFAKLTGYGAHELIGRNCRLLQRGVEDGQAHAKLRAFLARDDARPVRTPMVNFRKDGVAFVNLLYMSRLQAVTGETRYFLASQFDVSRTQPERLVAYDRALARTLMDMEPLAEESGMTVDRTLTAIADAVTTIAQAKLALIELGEDGGGEDGGPSD
jgi:PAS domain S-box-containing protein